MQIVQSRKYYNYNQKMKGGDKTRQKSLMHSSKVSIKESVMGACTNFMYKIGAMGGIKQVPKILKKESENLQETVILGQRYMIRKQAQEALQNLIWFTYRDKINLTEDLHSDVGWGCLPRVGQMLLAQAIIKKHKISGKKISKKQVIEHFVDNQNQQGAQYSLSNILKYARWKFNINPGEWFNIGQIVEVMRQIQDQTPMAGTDNLKAVFFSQSVIFKNKIVESAGYELCICSEQSKLFCRNCHYPKQQLEQKVEKLKIDSKYKKQKNQAYKVGSMSVSDRILEQDAKKSFSAIDNSILKPYYTNEYQIVDQAQSNQTQLKNNLLLIVSVRISQNKIAQDDYQSLLQLLSLPSSLGVIGGVPSKALYIVGYQKQELIYLDPHFVQQFVAQQNIQEFYSTFFCHNYRTIQKELLDPSMAFCFYLKTMEDVEQLINKIDDLRDRHQQKGQSLFISTMNSDHFTEQINTYKCSSFENSSELRMSEGYNSLEFQDIADSY